MGEWLRRRSNRETCLALLKERGRISNFDLMQAAGTRAGARIHELRQMGHRIRTEKVSDTMYVYIYESDQPAVQQQLL